MELVDTLIILSKCLVNKSVQHPRVCDAHPKQSIERYSPDCCKVPSLDHTAPFDPSYCCHRGRNPSSASPMREGRVLSMELWGAPHWNTWMFALCSQCQGPAQTQTWLQGNNHKRGSSHRESLGWPQGQDCPEASPIQTCSLQQYPLAWVTQEVLQALINVICRAILAH